METSGAYPFAAASAVLPVEIIGRRAHGVRDMARWERSEAVADVATFVDRMNAVAKRHDHRSPVPADVGRNVDATMAVLGHVADWAAEYEPVNDDLFTVAPSYRRFHDRLRADGYRLLIRTYGRPGDHRTVELPAYFERSFGDPETNAYGLEHELSFSMFLVALFKLHCLTSADERHVVAVLFDRYVDIVDRLIKSYSLEPSTKYGCSGLNDYWFLAFLWGSAQLAAANGNQHGLSPASAILDEGTARRHRSVYVFLKCMGAVHRRTNGGSDDAMSTAEKRRRPRPLWSHSYQLWNLTAFSRWDRVNDCLMKAFRRLVLERFQVVGHLVFGELLKFTPNPRPPGISFYNCIPEMVTTTAAAANGVTVVTGPTVTESDGTVVDEKSWE